MGLPELLDRLRVPSPRASPGFDTPGIAVLRSPSRYSLMPNSFRRRRSLGFLGGLALLAGVVCFALSDTPVPAQPRERVYILGFDGMDPEITERLMAEGKLPNLSSMKERGAMRRLEGPAPRCDG